MTHEDKRRILTSIPYKDGEIKIIIAKQDCVLGNHYHKKKTENFTLIKGVAILDTGGYSRMDGINSPSVCIKPNTRHSFKMEKDSILVCICSHPYDKTDDYE